MAARRWLIAPMLVFVLGVCLSQSDLISPRESAAEPATAAAKKPEDLYELYKLLADTIDQVEQNYVKDIDRRELIEAAIQGVLSKLDQHSSYIRPDELDQFRTSVEAEFGGVGIQVSVENGQLRIMSPLVGTPAYRAGLQAGDRIIKIEGEVIKQITIDEAVKRLKGPAGTKVSFTVLHIGDDKPHDVSLTREIIRVDTVLGDARKDSDAWDFMYDKRRKIGYIRISAFSRETAADLRKALDDLKGQNLRGLVLDLRFNPGGLLTSAIEVSDLFVAQGVIVSTQGRNTESHTWRAKAPQTFEGFPMAVLVNRYSASASEIVSACLQDHKRAVVIGERTWGKGSVQNVITLENGKSALKLTTASYQRPNGKNIHRFPDAKESDEWGVTPNDGYSLRLGDPELARLIRDRRDRDIVARKTGEDAGPRPPEPVDPDHAGDASNGGPVVDRQLQKAVEYLNAEIAKAD